MQVLITDDTTQFLKTKTLGFGCLTVRNKSSSDMGDNWHLFVLKEKEQIMMLLYCQFPQKCVCRVLSVLMSPT